MTSKGMYLSRSVQADMQLAQGRSFRESFYFLLAKGCNSNIGIQAGRKEIQAGMHHASGIILK